MAKTQYMYHATDYDKLGSILMRGVTPGPDGGVYLAETAQDALKFVVLRCYPSVLVIKIRKSKLNKELLAESFDHSRSFFDCRAWIYYGRITDYEIEEYTKYNQGL